MNDNEPRWLWNRIAEGVESKRELAYPLLRSVCRLFSDLEGIDSSSTLAIEPSLRTFTLGTQAIRPSCG